MPRFLMNIVDSERQNLVSGLHAPDLRTARTMALETACSAIAKDPDAFWAAGEWQMIVTDEGGLILFTLEMNATVAPAAAGHFPARRRS
ncbi:MAG TPA: hypothetical protein VFS39_05090 [Nitrospira sp.]|nr:hypothetical protein [Nitrospira sp.]